jgi:hypothetical protein
MLTAGMPLVPQVYVDPYLWYPLRQPAMYIISGRTAFVHLRRESAGSSKAEVTSRGLI